MFRHCVMLKFKDEATEAQRDLACKGISDLPNHIEEILSYSVGLNAGTRSDNYDLAVVGDFGSITDYDIYAAHPKHQEVITKLLAPIIEGRTAVQYFVEG